MKPGLYCIATPIGNLKDITLRAIEVLQSCHIIACEDTRVSAKLLSHYGIHKTKWSYHDHNAKEMRPKIIEAIQKGSVIALISDAGTPLISDPGTKLVKECQDLGLYVTTLPGPSAVLSALVLSGLMSHAFTFLGFFDKKHALTFQETPSSLVFFESPHRLIETLILMKDLFPKRSCAIIREITKMYEEVIRGDFETVIHHFNEKEPRGEIVIVISAPLEEHAPNDQDITHDLSVAMSTLSFKDAVDAVAKMHHVSKKRVYQLGLLKKEENKISNE